MHPLKLSFQWFYFYFIFFVDSLLASGCFVAAPFPWGCNRIQATISFFPFQLKFGRLHFEREKRGNAILYATALHRIGLLGALCCCYGLRVLHPLERYLHFSVFSPKCEQARAIPLSAEDVCVCVCVYLGLFSSWVLQLKRHLSIKYSLVFSLWCGKCLPVDFSYFCDGSILRWFDFLCVSLTLSAFLRVPGTKWE